jgi:hypothetical protein
VEGEADILITLSSDKIAEVMEVHFNEVLLKQRVRIVDLHSTSSGYAFALEFITDVSSGNTDVKVDGLKASANTDNITDAWWMGVLSEMVPNIECSACGASAYRESDSDVRCEVCGACPRVAGVSNNDVNSCVSSGPKGKKGSGPRRKNGRFISDISSTG